MRKIKPGPQIAPPFSLYPVCTRVPGFCDRVEGVRARDTTQVPISEWPQDRYLVLRSVANCAGATAVWVGLQGPRVERKRKKKRRTRSRLRGRKRMETEKRGHVEFYSSNDLVVASLNGSGHLPAADNATFRYRMAREFLAKRRNLCE